MLHYVVSNLIFNEKLKSATHSIEEIEHVCMLDVLIKKVYFVSSVSVEMTKVNALNKDKTVLLSCFKLAYLIRGSTFGIRRLFTSDHLFYNTFQFPYEVVSVMFLYPFFLPFSLTLVLDPLPRVLATPSHSGSALACSSFN